MKNNFLKLTGIAAMAILVFAACSKKEATDPSLKLNSSLAYVGIDSIVNGAFTTPLAAPAGSTGNWGSVDYDLFNVAVSSVAPHVSFDGAWCGDVSAASGYNLGYIDTTGISLATISLSTLSNASLLHTATVLGYNNTDPGWYGYTLTTHAVTPVANRYVVVYDSTTVAASTVVYALQITTITYTPSGANYYGNVTFKYKRLK